MSEVRKDESHAEKPRIANPNQAARRTIYGANVAVAVLAAVALAVLMNWLVDYGFQQANPSVRPWISYDLTATRRYSLSKQTIRVLSNLKKDYQIVTLFDPNATDPRVTERRQQVRDLVDDYQRYSSHLKVTHIDRPDLQVAQVEAFDKQVLSRFADKLAPTKSAIKGGERAIDDLTHRMPAMIKPLQAALKDPHLKNGKLKQLIQQVASLLTQDQGDLAKTNSHVNDLLNQPLPDYGGVKQSIQSTLEQLDEHLFAPAAQQFNHEADKSATPAAVQNNLLVSAKAMNAASDAIEKVVPKLKSVKAVSTYDAVRSAITNDLSVVILGPKQVRVVPLSRMFRQQSPQQIQQSGEQGASFLGEQQLTGALVSMTLKHPPMVVFVLRGSGAALGRRGQYTEVAKALRAANIDVRQWSPSGDMTTYGQRMPPQPPPMPGKGQKAVWVVLPAAQGNPMQMGGGSGQRIVKLLKDRLAKGDAAMFIVGPSATAAYGTPQPVVDMLKNWGIKAELDRLILTKVPRSDGATASTPNLTLDNWSSDFAVDRALVGLPGALHVASPLVLTQPKGKHAKVEQWPVIKVKGDHLWTTSNFTSVKAISEAKVDKTTQKPAFVVGAAAERNGQRVIVVGSPDWASNFMLQYGLAGQGTAAITGAAFPANGQLFVNSIYWLAGLDKLIAASPQAQDIRRVGPISNGAMAGYEVLLLLGLPMVVVGVGFGVWWMRRQE